ncbi:hypothetical protein P9112_004878 [Eukaryota sp. TZLM1-RC]
MSSFVDLFTYCVHLAKVANTILRKAVRDDETKVFVKDAATADFVTSVDLHVETIMVNALKYKFPSVRVIGEESITAVSTPIPSDCDLPVEPLSLPKTLPEYDLTDLCIWLDPLDGTSYFIKKEYHSVCFLLGISYKNRPIAGIITQPFADVDFDVCYGLPGIGMFFDGKQVEPKFPPLNELVITVSDSLTQSNVVYKTISRLGYAHLVHNHGTGTKFLTVCRGHCHAFVQALGRTKRWDTCAGEALVLAIGGCATDLDGNLINYDPNGSFLNDRGIVALSPVLCEEGRRNEFYERLDVPAEIPVTYK